MTKKSKKGRFNEEKLLSEIYLKKKKSVFFNSNMFDKFLFADIK